MKFVLPSCAASPARVFLATMLAAAAISAPAAVRVDDSGTIVSAPIVPMNWRQPVPGRGASHMVDAQLRVAVRLNLARWLNQPVRLYMVLAPVSGQEVLATWRTQGRLLAGTVRSGARSLVFEGRVSAPMLEETIELALSTDGRTLDNPQTLQFFFELDTP